MGKWKSNNRILNIKYSHGQSILEVIVAMAIFSLIGAAMATLVVGGFTGLEQGGEYTQAQALAQEGIEAVKSIQAGAWNEIIYSQSGVATSSNQWIFSGEDTSETIGQFTRTITFNDVCRDGSNDITDCPGSYTDVHSKKASVSVSWEIRSGVTNSVQRASYLTNWDSQDWTETDWRGQSGENVDTGTAGQLQLAEAEEGSWVLSGGTEVIQTSDTDFNAGTLTDTEVSGTGNDAKIILIQSATWAEHADSASATTRDLQDLSIASASNIWAVGKNGTIIHFDNSNWTATISPTTEELRGIDIRTASDSWAVGKKGKILHYDGSNWTEHTDTGNEDWYDVEAIASDDVWAVGKGGALAQYDGTNWTESTVPSSEDINGVYTISASNIWATGKSGRIWHYDGSSWTLHTDTGGETWNAIAMNSASSGWVIGNDGKIFEYSTFYDSSGTFESSIIDSGDISTNWNAASWTETLPTGSDITVATRTGNTATPDGTWSDWSGELTDPLGSDITSTDGQYLQYRVTFTRGSDATQTPEFEDITIIYNAPTTEDLSALSIVSASNIWAVGKNGKIIRYNGTDWTEHTDTGNEDWYDIVMISGSDGWTVGKNGALAEYNGATWTESTVPSSEDINGVYALSASDIWAAGKSGRIWHYDGASWSLYVDTGNETWNDISMISADEGWVVGDGGDLAEYDGTDWTKSTVPSSANINGIYALTASDIWAVGESGRFWRYNGTSWSLFIDTGGEKWQAVYLNNASDGWAVGDDGYIRQWLGTSWDSFSSPTTNDLNDLNMVSATSGWAIGKDGTILRFSRSNLYVTSGYLISSACDMSDTSPIQIIEWDETLPSGADIKFQIRTALTEAGLSGESWSSYFNTSFGELISTDYNDNRWVQYRVELSGDGTDTPVLQEVRINYK